VTRTDCKQSRRLALVLLASLIGCAGGNPDRAGSDGEIVRIDAPVAGSPMRSDGGRGQVISTDSTASPDGSTKAQPEAGPVAPGRPGVCGPGDVIDLDTQGVRSGNMVRFLGSNENASSAAELPGPEACNPEVGYEIAFRYTVRSESHIRVRTDGAGTSLGFDTVIWLLDRCASDAKTLACNDDASASDTARTSAFTTRQRFSTGSVVYVLVAGATPPASRFESTGTFELSVTELPEVPIGQVCDSTNACPENASCIGSGTRSICTADGGEGGRCRSTSPHCDSGLACTGHPDSVLSRCRPEVAVGKSCDPSGQTIACAEGSACVSGTVAATCVAHGSNGAPCRTTGAACDAGLACRGEPGRIAAVCRPAVKGGGICDPANALDTCVPGFSCARYGVAGLCMPDGTEGGGCRRTDPACDPGLVCTNDANRALGRCRRVAAAGARCDPQWILCATGTVCAEQRVCTPDGASGGRCRFSDQPCDAGLACTQRVPSSSARCRPAATVGSACDPRLLFNACVAGSACMAASSTSGVCVQDGTKSGRCRSAEPTCDADLSCTGAPSSSGSRCRPAVMLGQACDPRQIDNACPTGSTCATSPAMICVAIGANGGRCRQDSAMLCDAGLACSRPDIPSVGYCRPAVSIGGFCDVDLVKNACVGSSTCGIENVCVADGASGGRCRDIGAPCDGSLTCLSRRCLPTARIGEACDSQNPRTACAMGSSCQRVGTAFQCVADGTNGGRCRTSGTFCDSGLSCTFGLCRPIVAPGMACDRSGALNVCAAGTSCRDRPTPYTCVPDGSEGARCRPGDKPCDTGLACSGHPRAATSRCRTEVAAGAFCDTTRTSNVCITGTTCLAAGTGARCVQDGSERGVCRPMDPECDSGLKCSGERFASTSRCLPI
jgi:hypothetical protein